MTRSKIANCLLMIATVLALPAVATCAESVVATPAAPANQPAIAAVELAKALAWPIAALMIAVLLYRPLNVFVAAIGSRITKLSLFRVELELVPATSATSTPLLDDIRSIMSSATFAQISDSTRSMTEQVQSTTPADYAVIKLGDGHEWLTSRLYIALIMMQRMRGMQVFVFVERTATTEQRLVAVAPVDQLRWALAQRYPWLEAAWVRANLLAFPSSPPPAALAPMPTGPTPASTGPALMPILPVLPPGAHWLPNPCAAGIPQLISSKTGGFEPWQAQQIVTNFITSLQQASKPVAPQEPTEWEALSASRHERASWVTRALLASLLPPETFLAWANDLRDAPKGQRTRAVLRRAGAFVALTEGDRELVRLADRRALLEEIAASLGEELETRSSSGNAQAS